MILGIVGSRRRCTKEDKALIKKMILKLKPDRLVSGGCRTGADKFAEELAKELKIPIQIFLPSFPSTGSYYSYVSAYYKRNKQIAMYSDKLLAVVAPDRKGGTENTIMHFLKNHKKGKLMIL